MDVTLIHAPVQLIAEEERRQRDLVREFALMRIGASNDGGPPVHFELLSLLDSLDHYRDQMEPGLAALEDSYLRGEDATTVTFHVPVAVSAVIDRLRSVFERVDIYSGDDAHLLTLPPTPSAKRMRHWYLGEFVRQIDGAQPTPWDGPLN